MHPSPMLHRKTTAYHSQTNDVTECVKTAVADMLSTYEDIEHKTWDVILPYMTFTYNTA